jgi:hypothetical protein
MLNIPSKMCMIAPQQSLELSALREILKVPTRRFFSLDLFLAWFVIFSSFPS